VSILASDGLRARESGAWTREKLTYLGKYAAAFMTAMAPKRREGKWDRLVYIDLLAGPGICKDERGEFPGSALIALGVRPAFDHLFLGDKSTSNVEALKRRVPTEDQKLVTFLADDCNDAVTNVIENLSSKTLGLAFLDPEGLDVKFKTLRTLATRRVDIVYLFPSGIGIRRNLARFAREPHSRMDDVWGGREWRDLPLAKHALGELTSHEEMRLDRDWISSFRRKVGTLGLSYHDESDPAIRNNQGAVMYHLLFFSHDKAGLTIWKGIKRIAPTGQREFRF